MSIPEEVDLSQVPLQAPPIGRVSNFVNPPTLSHAVTSVGVLMAAITACFVVARLKANLRVVRRLGLDDLFCVFAFILITAYTGIVISLNSTARHPWVVPISTFADPAYSKKVYVLGMIFGPGMCFAKCAILILYRRIFKVSRTLQMLIWFGIFVVTATYWVSIPLFTYDCTPRSGHGWDLTLLTKCKHNGVLALIQGVIGVAIDIYIFILPLPTILQLTLPLKKKLGVAAIFMTGLIGIVAAAVALYFRVLNWERTDTTWNSAKVYILVFTESYVTIIVSCAPAMASLWKHVITKSYVFKSLKSLLSSQRTRTATQESGRKSDRSNEKGTGQMPRLPSIKPFSAFSGLWSSNRTAARAHDLESYQNSRVSSSEGTQTLYEDNVAMVGKRSREQV